MPTTKFQIASGSKSTLWFAIGFSALLVGIPLGLLFFTLPNGLLTFHVSDRASDRGLIITGDPYGRAVAQADLKASEARRLDLEADPKYRLTSRTNGTGLPLYQSGWFNTQGAGKVLVFASDWTRAVIIPTKLDYTLILTPESPDDFLADLAKPRSDGTSFLLATPPNHTPGVPPGVIRLWVIVLGLPVSISVLLLWICLRSRHVLFELSDEGLRIKGDLYGRLIPRASLIYEEATLINLKKAPDRLALWRSNGVGMPGYASGWHRQWNTRASFLVFLTDITRVVRIPTRDGYVLLISPAAPDSFLSAIHQFTL